jgi:hypothetical protein
MTRRGLLIALMGAAGAIAVVAASAKPAASDSRDSTRLQIRM